MFLGLFFFRSVIHGQDASQLAGELMKVDSAAITALALYPGNVRKNILEVCTYPQSLVRIESLQKSTSESFRKALENYSREDQQKAWNLARYPELASKLALKGKGTNEELEKVVSEYPEEIRQTAREFVKTHHDLLRKMEALNVSSIQAFEAVIIEYPEPVKNSLRELVKYPELINILTGNMKMSVLVGDIYRRQPKMIMDKLDSISIGHAAQNAKDLEEWKAGLEKNPEAKKEMEQASKEFAKEQGYTEDDLAVKSEAVVVNYVIHPYPYWYGYPWWYDYPYWYPYPYWYDWGFYYGPYGIVYIGFPSPFFSFWYFHHPPHHYRYNHFSDYCVKHYYGPRRAVTGFHQEVSHWVRSAERHVPKDFFMEHDKRPEKIKEFGKFEMEYEKAVKGDPGRNITRDNFIQANAASFPYISPVLNEKGPKSPAPVIYDKPRQTPVYEERPRPSIIPGTPKPIQPVVPAPRPKPVPSKPVNPAPVPKPAGKRGLALGSQGSVEESIPKDNFRRMNEALNYHRSGWSNK